MRARSKAERQEALKLSVDSSWRGRGALRVHVIATPDAYETGAREQLVRRCGRQRPKGHRDERAMSAAEV
jgi:hypothetical protein